MDEDSKITSQRKWTISFMSGILFFIIASPFIFTWMNELTKTFGLVIATSSGCPNYAGLLINAILFTLIVRAMM